jgi:hypothetical protein
LMACSRYNVSFLYAVCKPFSSLSEDDMWFRRLWYRSTQRRANTFPIPASKKLSKSAAFRNPIIHWSAYHPKHSLKKLEEVLSLSNTSEVSGKIHTPTSKTSKTKRRKTRHMQISQSFLSLHKVWLCYYNLKKLRLSQFNGLLTLNRMNALINGRAF